MTELDTDSIMRNIVLRNQLVFGTVNAGRSSYETAIHKLEQFMTLFPASVRHLITGRSPLEEARHLVTRRDGIKNVVQVSTKRYESNSNGARDGVHGKDDSQLIHRETPISPCQF